MKPNGGGGRRRRPAETALLGPQTASFSFFLCFFHLFLGADPGANVWLGLRNLPVSQSGAASFLLAAQSDDPSAPVQRGPHGRPISSPLRRNEADADRLTG